jgi:hypothetical protein
MPYLKYYCQEYVDCWTLNHQNLKVCIRLLSGRSSIVFNSGLGTSSKFHPHQIGKLLDFLFGV